MGGVFEVLAPGLTGLLQHIGEGGLLLALLGGAGAVLRAGVVLGHLHAELLGQVFDGFNEGHARVLHQETDGVAVLAATKAVVELFGRADRERGRFFAVKRAQAHVVGAPLFELHVAAHDLHHIRAGDQFLDEGLGDGHRYIFAGVLCPRSTANFAMTCVVLAASRTSSTPIKVLVQSLGVTSASA